jgi:hypothetical protein
VARVKPAAIEEAPVELGSPAPTIERLLEEEPDAYLRFVAVTPLFEGSSRRRGS